MLLRNVRLFFRTAPLYFPENCSPYSDRRENLKSNTLNCMRMFSHPASLTHENLIFLASILNAYLFLITALIFKNNLKIKLGRYYQCDSMTYNRF